MEPGNEYGLSLPDEEACKEWEEEQKTPTIPTKTMEQLMQQFRPTKPIRPSVLRQLRGEERNEAVRSRPASDVPDVQHVHRVLTAPDVQVQGMQGSLSLVIRRRR